MLDAVQCAPVASCNSAHWLHVNTPQHAGVRVALQCNTALNDGVLILALCLLQILSSVAQLTEQEWQYTLTASCIEVYNNQLR